MSSSFDVCTRSRFYNHSSCMEGVQTVLPPHLYPYSQTRCPNETKHRVLLRMSTLFLYLTFPCGLPRIQYGGTYAEHIFQTFHSRIPGCSQNHFPIAAWTLSQVRWIPLMCFLRSANRTQMVPNPGCREGVGQCKSNAVCCCCNGCASLGCSVIILKKYQPVSVISGIDSFFLASQGSSLKSWSWFLYPWQCTGKWCLCSPREWWACIFVPLTMYW